MVVVRTLWHLLVFEGVPKTPEVDFVAIIQACAFFLLELRHQHAYANQYTITIRCPNLVQTKFRASCLLATVCFVANVLCVLGGYAATQFENPLNHSLTKSINQPVRQCINQGSKQSLNTQSINQSTKRSVNRSIDLVSIWRASCRVGDATSNLINELPEWISYSIILSMGGSNQK